MIGDGLDKATILFVGDFEAPQFAAAVGRLRGRGDLHCVAHLPAAESFCRMRSPSLIVFGQLRPGQFNSAEVETLHRIAPLARMVALLGSWCEGETRTGSPWPGVTRIYWHQLTGSVAAELFGESAAKWALPRTSTEVERLMNAPADRPPQQGLIVVRTDDKLSFDVISELLVDAGYAAARVCRDDRISVAGAVAAIWDSALSIAEDRGSLARFAKRLWPAPTVALVGFLREADRRLALECGASTALGKPLLITELLDELESARLASLDRTTADYRETA